MPTLGIQGCDAGAGDGGEIAATSAGSGCGSAFTVTLPLLHPEVVSHERPTSSTVDQLSLSGVRVLVVDDEADTRATLRALLEQFGARPAVVATASEAFTVVRQSPPNVLLSDIAVHGEEGYTLIRRIRTTVDAAHLPAAALSAHVDKETKAHAADAGFQDHLTQPIDPMLLAQALVRLFRGTDSPHVL
jgi:CheY-like chemotaxis protein